MSNLGWPVKVVPSGGITVTEAPNGATTIANAATPTVAELLEFCMGNRAKIADIIAALKA